MNDKLIYLLSDVLGEYQIRSKSDVAFYCPFCHHRKKKLEVNLETEKWQCWVCGERDGNRGSDVHSLLVKLKSDKSNFERLKRISKKHKPKFEQNVIEEKVIRLPKEFIPLWLPGNSPEYKNALMFLMRRGLKSYDIEKYQIGYCEEGRYKYTVIIPSFDKNFNLNYWVSRSYYKDENAYMNPDLGKGSKDVIAFESTINWDEPIILVEGFLDAIAYKRNTVPLIGKTLSKKLKSKLSTLKEGSIVYIGLDADAVKEAVNIGEYLIKNDLRVFVIDFVEKEDPSKLGFVKAWEKLENKSFELTSSSVIQYKLNNI